MRCHRERPGLIPARAGRTPIPARSTRGTRAHPRSRGEDGPGARPAHPDWGSSPLARGGHRRERRGPRARGLIPARAGRTWGVIEENWSGRAHPRSRGEDGSSHALHTSRSGSSPLARGGRTAPHLHRCGAGLIPARAGRTAWSARCRPGRGAHPRSRGEDTPTAATPAHGWGSSPLARGGLPGEGARDGRDGLIPARAGRTSMSSAWSTERRAHPRSRGEDRCGVRGCHGEGGSSPLARGGLGALRHAPQGLGLIPARAGRTDVRRRSSVSVRAHPRSRGEDLGRNVSDVSDGGSSPLARGGQAFPQPELRDHGLIPARAGRTRRGRPRCARAGAHPRSRGEDVDPVSAAPEISGSSPLARGGRPAAGKPSGLLGLIPARAGRTTGTWSRSPAWRAHPRSRGEDERPDILRHRGLGSSPLARGGRR